MVAPPPPRQPEGTGSRKKTPLAQKIFSRSGPWSPRTAQRDFTAGDVLREFVEARNDKAEVRCLHLERDLRGKTENRTVYKVSSDAGLHEIIKGKGIRHSYIIRCLKIAEPVRVLLTFTHVPYRRVLIMFLSIDVPE